MSDLLHSSQFDHLDDKTKSIVNGIVTSEIKLITHQVPNEIIILTLLYVDDHFMMNRDSFRWNITNQRSIQSILTSPTDFILNSEVFELCGM